MENNLETSNVDVLVASLNKTMEQITQQLNIEGNVIVANQGQPYDTTVNYASNKRRVYISTDTIGVGRNRNIALNIAKSKYCILADDDIQYISNYAAIIENAFNANPDADLLIFNIKSIGDDRGRRINTRTQRVNVFNFMNYGSVRIAFRRESIVKSNIGFSTLFGGGSKYSAGEDVTFLRDCLRAKLKIIALPIQICIVDQTKSTWFTGYNEKYFFDKGALIYHNFRMLRYPLIYLYFPMKFRKMTHLSFFQSAKWMLRGFKGYRNSIDYLEFVSKLKEKEVGH